MPAQGHNAKEMLRNNNNKNRHEFPHSEFYFMRTPLPLSLLASLR